MTPHKANGLHVPAPVAREVEANVAEYRRTHNDCYPPTHPRAGADSERAYIGLPGHCDYCAIAGHVVAHPDYGCGDVRCHASH